MNRVFGGLRSQSRASGRFPRDSSLDLACDHLQVSIHQCDVFAGVQPVCETRMPPRPRSASMRSGGGLLDASTDQ
jgi:hypothetical protein